MSNIIITGASGLLGQYLCRDFSNRFKVIGLYNSSLLNIPNIEAIKTDLTDLNAVQKVVQSYNPTFVIHTAGHTSVDECEKNPEKAFLLNVHCMKNLTSALAGHQTKLINISTDHLFSGKEKNYTEESIVQPLNIYAQTKFLAEEESLKLPKTISIRTNFYGGRTDKKMSFSSWIISELSQGHTINMYDDVFFTPISICSLAKNIELLMNSNLSGIYNVTGSERLSKYEFALKLADVFKFSPTLVNRSQIPKTNFKPQRPLDMSLSISKIQKDLIGFESEDVSHGLKKIQSLGLI